MIPTLVPLQLLFMKKMMETKKKSPRTTTDDKAPPRTIECITNYNYIYAIIIDVSIKFQFIIINNMLMSFVVDDVSIIIY